MCFSGTCAAWKDGLLLMLKPSQQSVGTRLVTKLPFVLCLVVALCSGFLIFQLKHLQEELLPGGHGLMVRGYRPVINTLSKGLDIRLSHR